MSKTDIILKKLANPWRRWSRWANNRSTQVPTQLCTKGGDRSGSACGKTGGQGRLQNCIGCFYVEMDDRGRASSSKSPIAAEHTVYVCSNTETPGLGQRARERERKREREREDVCMKPRDCHLAKGLALAQKFKRPPHKTPRLKS